MTSRTPDMATLIEHYWQRPATPAEQAAMRAEVKRHTASVGKRPTSHNNLLFDVDPDMFCSILEREAD